MSKKAPTAAATTDAVIAASLIASSWAFGMTMTSAAPTSGTNVITLKSQLLSNSMGELSLHEHDEEAGNDGCGGEHDGGVLLDLAPLDCGAAGLTEALGRLS